MRKITLILTLLLCFTLGAAAQQVAENATTVDALTSGYYVIKVKSNDEKATASYLYANSKKVYFDAPGSEKTFAGNSIDATEMSYLFYITKNEDGTLNISLWNDQNTYWPNISTAKSTNKTPGRQGNGFGMNKNKGTFTATESDGAYILSLASSYWVTKGFLGANSYAENCTAFVTLNDKNIVGYYDWQQDGYENEATIAKVQFYAVSGTPLTTPIAVTYNFKHGDETYFTETHEDYCYYTGTKYPSFSTDLDAYYMTASVPEGTIDSEDAAQSFDIDLSAIKLPFETSRKYYYLGTAGDSPVMISRKSADKEDMAYRTMAQAENLNDIVMDLWYITGNVFDGFRFVNVGNEPATAVSSYGIETNYGDAWPNPYSNSAVLAFEGTEKGTDLWDIKKGENGGFIIYTHSGESYNRYWSYKDGAINFINKDGYEKNFQVYEPEFTFKMNPVGDASYNTIALPFAAEPAEGENTKMYKGKVSDTTLNLTEIDALPANAGAVLIGEQGAETAKFVALMDAYSLDDNDLVGTTEEIANADLSDKLIFGVSDQTGNVGFYSANSSAKLNANRAYINKTSTNMKALAIRIGGEPTGIVLPTENAPAANAPVYDLSGRRVNSTIKGHLYIQNGRKFIAE